MHEIRYKFQSFIHPATESLMSNWIPPGERVKYAGAFLGNAFGMFITWPISGLLIHYIGWEWSFHQVTIQVVIFCILFGLYASDGPQNNRWISEEEKLTIAQNMSETYLVKKIINDVFILKESLFSAEKSQLS